MTEGKTGFFVKVSKSEYEGPFSRLSEARNIARSKGPNIKIYHGLLKITDGVYDTKDLHLVPRLELR